MKGGAQGEEIMQGNLYQRWALLLVEKNHLPREKTAVLAYAMETLFINTLNLLLTMLIAYLLGVLGGTLICILVAVSYRHTAGGAHSSSPWICAAATMTIFPSLAYAATFIAAGPGVCGRLAALTAVLLGVYSIHRYAPVDSVQAPIISPERRKRLKKYSYVVVMVFVVGIILLEALSASWHLARILQVCAALTILWVSFNLTPTAAYLWSWMDNQLDSKNRR
jgi:accessory gene regulator B